MLVQRNYEIVDRQWGFFLKFTDNEKTTVKLLKIEKGKSISLQFHKMRAEQWFVVSGKVWVTKGSLTQALFQGESINIDVGEIHKMEGLEDSVILEISRGHFDEEDIVRL